MPEPPEGDPPGYEIQRAYETVSSIKLIIETLKLPNEDVQTLMIAAFHCTDYHRGQKSKVLPKSKVPRTRDQVVKKIDEILAWCRSRGAIKNELLIPDFESIRIATQDAFMCLRLLRVHFDDISEHAEAIAGIMFSSHSTYIEKTNLLPLAGNVWLPFEQLVSGPLSPSPMFAVITTCINSIVPPPHTSDPFVGVPPDALAELFFRVVSIEHLESLRRPVFFFDSVSESVKRECCEAFSKALFLKLNEMDFPGLRKLALTKTKNKLGLPEVVNRYVDLKLGKTSGQVSGSSKLTSDAIRKSVSRLRDDMFRPIK